MFNSKIILIAGDTQAIAVVTIIGFATHNEMGAAFLPRMAVIIFPLAISWFILAPWFGLFQPEITSNPKQLWLPVLAMIFVAPLTVTVRSAFLTTDVKPIFVLVFGVTSAFGLCLWRGIYFLLKRKP